MFLKIAILLILISGNVYGSYQDAVTLFEKGGINSSSTMLKVMEEMIESGFYYSLVPDLKEQIASNQDSMKRVDALLERIIYKVGIKPFESLPVNILNKTNSHALRFVVAKKLFRVKKYNLALEILKTIPSSHFLSPFASHIEASIHSIEKKYKVAINKYDECVDSSDGSAPTKAKQRQLNANKDYCIVGKARALYANKQYDKADLAYLDLPKSSYIWPEILFEEAWNSFYQGNYNRTLGKLVTYKSPFLDFIYNPEVDVLNAFTYLKMCLWDDVKKSVDRFYDQFMGPSEKIRKILMQKKKDFKFYYDSALSSMKGDTFQFALFEKMLKSVVKEPAYMEMIESMENALEEHKRVEKLSQSDLKNVLMANVLESIRLQRDTIGAYVRKRLIDKYGRLFRAFQQMSYIKLEVLTHKKRQLYISDVDKGRTRGDLQYVERNEKQYFWTFNGEFWADELGDYVFALRSECRK